MKIELKGRKAIVTGSTAGIGRAIAEGLARAGASVVINGRGEQRVAAALQELRVLLPEADFTGVVADLSTAEGSAALVAQVKDADILVNNLGTAHLNGFFEQKDSEWLDLFQLNVMSSDGAAKSAAAQHAKVVWALSCGLGDRRATNIKKYLASLYTV